MHQIRFRLGLRPRPRLQRFLDTLAGFKGGASRQGEGRDWEREGREMTGTGRGGEEGRESKGKDAGGKETGDRGNGRDRTWDGTGMEGKGGRVGKGRRGATAPKLQFLAPPLDRWLFDVELQSRDSRIGVQSKSSHICMQLQPALLTINYSSSATCPDVNKCHGYRTPVDVCCHRTATRARGSKGNEWER